MWSVQVTGSLRVLNPAACTASIKVWLGAGFPKLVTVGSPSKELPRFHPGGITLTTSCGVRATAPPEPASAPLEEASDALSPEVEELEPVSEALGVASMLDEAEFASVP